jgi:selenocysteine lyase/cysteine desulfurase
MKFKVPLTKITVLSVKSQKRCFSNSLTFFVQKHPMPIYLDAQATTKMDERVLTAMLPYFKEEYGNPHSRTHQYGWDAEEAVEAARLVLIH